MKRLRLLFATLLAISFAVAGTISASARAGDKPNSGICNSGQKVGNIKNCRENGGTK